MDQQPAQEYLRLLRQAMMKHFDLDELQMLAFDLGIDWDELSGSKKSTKIQALLLHLSHNYRLAELLSLLQQERPQIGWPTLPQEATKPALTTLKENDLVRILVWNALYRSL